MLVGRHNGSRGVIGWSGGAAKSVDAESVEGVMIDWGGDGGEEETASWGLPGDSSLRQWQKRSAVNGDILLPVAKKARQLDLSRLSGGSPPGITPEMGAFAAQAAAVLLEHNEHQSGVNMEVIEQRTNQYKVLWPKLHKNARRTHNDLPEAAEQGAYGIAFLLAEEFTQFKVIERSRKGTGFDYWLGTGDQHPFQQAARMEVSAIIDDVDAVDARVKAKMRQTDASKGRLPAFVAVVEFGKPTSVFKKR